MTRDEELKLIDEAIRAGKLRKITPTENQSYKPTQMQIRTARALKNNSRNAAKRLNSKTRELKYRELGLT